MAITSEDLIKQLQAQGESVNQNVNINEVNSRITQNQTPALGGLRGRDVRSLSAQEQSRIGFEDFRARTGGRASNIDVNNAIQTNRDARRNTDRINALVQTQIDEELFNRAFGNTQGANAGTANSGRPQNNIVRTSSGLITNESGAEGEVLATPQDDFDFTQLPPERQESIIQLTRGIQSLEGDARQSAIDNITDPITKRAIEQLIDLDLSTERERIAANKASDNPLAELSKALGVGDGATADTTATGEQSLADRIKAALGIN